MPSLFSPTYIANMFSYQSVNYALQVLPYPGLTV